MNFAALKDMAAKLRKITISWGLLKDPPETTFIMQIRPSKTIKQGMLV